MFTETFGVSDYIVCVMTLCMSAGIGIYFGCFNTKQNTAKEYLYGKGGLKAIPIGLSLYSSAISAISIAGIPAEVYTFGVQFMLSSIGILLSTIITWCFVLPVFCGDLTLTSPYEYFEKRFNYKIRVMSTVIYIIHTLLYQPVILYATTVNFSEITQISLPVCITIIGGICIFYTMLGGFNAVIWSDTLQATLMFASCIFVMTKGIIDLGGMSEVLRRADQGQRLNFLILDPNPFRRTTFWSATIGICFSQVAHSGFAASSIQRYMALKSEKQARISAFIAVIGYAFSTIIVAMIGLTMYAQYYDCDPVKNQDVSNYNKLLSHYVAHIVRNIPALLGFFNAGILCAGLSTLSAELNTLSGLTYHCLIKKIYKKPISETRGAIIMKLIVLITGIYYLSVAPFLDRLKHLTSLAFGLGGVTYGGKIGMMVLGTTFKKCNSIGVACGTIIGIFVMAWIHIGALYNDVNTSYLLPQSIENCPKSNLTEIYNSTTVAPKLDTTSEEPFFIYKLSYMYYTLFGTIITIIFSLLISCLTGGNDHTKMDQNLFIPWVRSKDIEKHCDEELKMLN